MTKQIMQSVLYSLLLLLFCSWSTEAGLFSQQNTTVSNEQKQSSEWLDDLLHLPIDGTQISFAWPFLSLTLYIIVPFPGYKWLDRFSADDSVSFEFNGETYSSVYAAMLDNNPLSHPARNLNCYVNSIFVPTKLAHAIARHTNNLSLAHYIISYVRNLFAGIMVYYSTAGIFHYFCYIHPSTSQVFQNGGRPYPSRAIIWNQIKLAQTSLFLYTLLPVVDDYLIEQNITKMYYSVHEIGGYLNYCLTMILYFLLVEIGIYWMHRTLHTNKFLYKHIHMLHHQYNKPETLTPWASIAFHPIDGILQASPYEVFMFVVPCHYLSHMILIFGTAIWATYIHDAMDFNVDPIMGSKYHTVHHTHYIYNYGQVFTFCDWFWGTLAVPLEPTGGNTKQTFKKIN